MSALTRSGTLDQQWQPAFTLIAALLRGDRAAARHYAETVDSTDLRAMLVRHGVALALPAASALSDTLPEPLTTALSERQKRAAMAVLKRALTISMVAKAFNSARIPFLVIKGIAFATLFDKFSNREGADIDLLVHPQDRDRALTCLQALDYRLSDVTPAGLDAHFATDHAVSLYRNGPWPMIELHLRFGYDDRQFPIALFDPWSHVTQVRIGNTDVPTLDKVQAVVYAAVHGTRHHWNRLMWLVDIVWALEDPDLDWQAVLTFARRLSVERQVMLAVSLAEDLLAAKVPAAVRAEDRQRQRVRPLAATLAPVLDDLPGGRWDLALYIGLGPYIRWLFVLHETGRAKFGLLLFLLATTQEDRDFLPLPPWLSWAYPVVRGLRILGWRLPGK